MLGFFTGLALAIALSMIVAVVLILMAGYHAKLLSELTGIDDVLIIVVSGLAIALSSVLFFISCNILGMIYPSFLVVSLILLIIHKYSKKK
jgi:FtsH-binding integral membrane protein